MADTPSQWNRPTVQAVLVSRALTDGASLADTVAVTWRRVADTLAPVIGELGVVALFDRSLHLAETEFPWLSSAQRGTRMASSRGNLRLCIAAREGVDPDGVAAASSAHLCIFAELLALLIGQALSERLLQPAWPGPAGPAAMEIEP